MGTDWSNDQFAVETDGQGDGLVRPPFALVGIVGLLGLVSVVFFLGSSSLGYLTSVIASVSGGVTALVDQKRRGNSNYVSYDSFRLVLGIARYGVLLIAIGHIVRLAFDVARGGSIF
ncbi:MAG: hypothetical protein ACKOI2_12775 [Actinomycetota bacterium]